MSPQSLAPCQWGTIRQALTFAPAPLRRAQQGSQSRAPSAQAGGSCCPAEAGELLACSLPRWAGAESCLQAAVPYPRQTGYECIPARWPRTASVGRAVALLPRRVGRVRVGVWMLANQSTAQVGTCALGMLLAATDTLAQACVWAITARCEGAGEAWASVLVGKGSERGALQCPEV